MSTAIAGAQTVTDGGERPGYWLTFRAVAVGLLGGGILLWAASAVLSLTSLVGISNGGLSEFAPWVIDGPWSLVAVIAWGLLVSALFGWLVRRRIEARTTVVLSRALTMAAVAVSGYGPWLVAATPTARMAISLFLAPAVVRFATFEHSGRPRLPPARLELTPARLRALLLVSVLGVAGPFSLLHPFAVRGSESSGNSSQGTVGNVFDTAQGKVVQAAAGIENGLFPVAVTAVRILGDTRAIRILSVQADHLPELGSARYPIHLRARGSLWVTYRVALGYCADPLPAITRIRLDYSELGLALSQTVPLGGANTLLSCGSA